jgi:hypothetical protein
MDYDYAVEYSQTWSGGLQYAIGPATMAEVSYMGTWTLGADNATVRNVRNRVRARFRSAGRFPR